jgi:hypothetical protein
LVTAGFAQWWDEKAAETLKYLRLKNPHMLHSRKTLAASLKCGRS